MVKRKFGKLSKSLKILCPLLQTNDQPLSHKLNFNNGGQNTGQNYFGQNILFASETILLLEGATTFEGQQVKIFARTLLSYPNNISLFLRKEYFIRFQIKLPFSRMYFGEM